MQGNFEDVDDDPSKTVKLACDFLRSMYDPENVWPLFKKENSTCQTSTAAFPTRLNRPFAVDGELLPLFHGVK